MCLGKALGGGVMPLSAFMSTPRIWSVLEQNPFIHTSTFGGNPLACAAGIAAIHVTLEEDLPAQAMRKGKYLLGELVALQIRYDRLIRRARGKGLLLGVEFENTEIGYKVVAGLFRRGVVVAGTLTNSRVVRFEPALNTPDKLLDEVLEILEDTLDRGRQGDTATSSPRTTIDAHRGAGRRRRHGPGGGARSVGVSGAESRSRRPTSGMCGRRRGSGICGRRLARARRPATRSCRRVSTSATKRRPRP